MAFNGKLGDLSLQVKVDTKRLKQGLNEAHRHVQSATKRMQASLRTWGTRLSIGLTAPLVLFGRSAIKAAADAEEMRNKFNIVFGSMAKSTHKWADTFGKSVGRSRVLIKGYAADSQSLLISAGLQTKAASEMSKALTELALDWASFSNAQDEQAINAFQKALLGENETLKGVGLVLQQADVQRELATMGIKKNWNEVDRASKAQAVYSALVKRTTQAKNDLRNTTGSATNKMKAFSSAMLDLKIAVGQDLLPIITPLVSGLTDAVNAFTDLPAPVRTATIAFAGMLAVVGPLALAISFISAPALAASAAIAAVALGLYNFRKIVSVVSTLLGKFSTFIGPRLTRVFTLWLTPLKLLYSAFKILWTYISKAYNAMVKWLGLASSAKMDTATAKTKTFVSEVADANAEITKLGSGKEAFEFDISLTSGETFKEQIVRLLKGALEQFLNSGVDKLFGSSGSGGGGLFDSVIGGIGGLFGLGAIKNKVQGAVKFAKEGEAGAVLKKASELTGYTLNNPVSRDLLNITRQTPDYLQGVEQRRQSARERADQSQGLWGDIQRIWNGPVEESGNTFNSAVEEAGVSFTETMGEAGKALTDSLSVPGGLGSSSGGGGGFSSIFGKIGSIFSGKSEQGGDAVQEGGEQGGDAIREGAEAGANSLKSAGEGLSGSLGGLFGGLGGLLGGGGGGGIFGSILGSIGGILGGGGDGGGGLGGLLGFADGGVPPVGVPSIVGENGPELFVPSGVGAIVPNGGIGGGGVTVVNNNNFTGVNSVNRQELMQALENNRQRTLSDVENMATRGGSFSKAMRGS
jgi:hypothetical protein